VHKPAASELAGCNGGFTPPCGGINPPLRFSLAGEESGSKLHALQSFALNIQKYFCTAR
jgi:hypothetical protein